VSEASWVEPYPDVLLEGIADRAAGPEARYEVRESLSLAFVVALQQLTPRQRAVLVLRDVLGFRAAEVARMLDSSEPSVNSALRRARAVLAERAPGRVPDAPLPGSPAERALLARFVEAFENGDVPRTVALLTDDAWLTMPPLPVEYQGHRAATDFLTTVGFRGGKRFRLVPVLANGQPAFGCYVTGQTGPARAHGVLVLTLRGDRISALTRFVDNSLLPWFGLPRSVRLD
jgi:RNA polymerase sigma-70 factor (ECF subfamily)